MPRETGFRFALVGCRFHLRDWNKFLFRERDWLFLG